MTRLNQTLLVCAALVAPWASRAGEAQQDPRAQVTTGFGPQARAPRLVPPEEKTPDPTQPQPDLSWMVASYGAGVGLAVGTFAGVSISSSNMNCRSGIFGLPGGECVTGGFQSVLIGMSAGAAGAVVGGWVAATLYRWSRIPVQVTPVAGKGAQGLAISGTF